MAETMMNNRTASASATSVEKEPALKSEHERVQRMEHHALRRLSKEIPNSIVESMKTAQPSAADTDMFERHLDMGSLHVGRKEFSWLTFIRGNGEEDTRPQDRRMITI